ncbi:MAG: glycosyltransferase [Planctomycetota bacterium]
MTPATEPLAPPVRGQTRIGGDVRRVLFYGKSMARSACSPALQSALREHGIEVRWRNLARWRRWFGRRGAEWLARREFARYRPDLVFVFWRDLPRPLLEDFRRRARVLSWCEEPLFDLDDAMLDYFALFDVVCMSNPGRFAAMRARGLDNMLFAMSGFATDFHRPLPPAAPVRDVAFIGTPGLHTSRVEFLARVAERYDVEVFGRGWERHAARFPRLRLGGTVEPPGYARVCATSRIVLGINEVNDDPYYFSNRTFLTLACRGFHLTHYVPRLENVFERGVHLDWFADEDEALERIAYWLPRDQERARVAEQGHRLVLARHRYYDRVTQILDRLRTGRRDEPLLEVERA